MTEYADEQFFDLMDRFDSLMLTTQTPDGAMRARPMAVAHRRDDGVIYLLTDLDAGKVDEIARAPQVCATMQGRQRCLSLSGKAEIIQDRRLMEEIWEDGWERWFPQGATHPTLAVLKLVPSNGEYWDWSISQKLRFVWEAGRALLTTGKLDFERLNVNFDGHNDKVSFV